MAKEKKSKGSSGVKLQGDKYVCTECHQEVPIKKVCPICGKEIDWDRVLMETRH